RASRGLRRKPLDSRGRERPWRPGARPRRFALRAVCIARRSRIPESHVVGAALCLRRSRGETSAMKPTSDALVFFGAPGDLAYKKIFPALQSMAARGTLEVPVIG